MRDLYALLGIHSNASADEIRQAYRRLLLLYRPETTPASSPAGTQFREIQLAYETLSDPEKRAEYDASNHGAGGGRQADVPPDGSGEPRLAWQTDSGLPGPGPTYSTPAYPAGEPIPRRAPAEPRRARKSRNPIDRLTARLPRPWRIAIDWILTIAGAIAIVLAIKAWVVNPYRIPSSSMEPTLHCARPGQGCEASLSDRVLACRFCYHLRSPHRGDVVVFKTPEAAKLRCGAGGTFVKRLIGLPGETWEERHGYIYINGKQLNEPYIKPDRRDTDTHAAEKIPSGDYLMLGDNRAQSCDSRVWGPVPRGNLIGPVFFTYWPPNRISFR